MADLGQQLYNACYHRDLAEVAQLLDAGANKEWRDGEGCTPIIRAAIGDASPQSNCLLTAGQTFTRATTKA